MKNIITHLCVFEGEMNFPKEKEKFNRQTKTDAYDKLRSKLSEDDKKLLDDVYEEFQGNHIEETEIYYRLGIKTGFSLAQELL